MKKRFLQGAPWAARCRVLCVLLAVLTVAGTAIGTVSALSAAVLSVGAEAPGEEVTHMRPTPKENIILNAYLFPVFDDADLRMQMQYCRDADIDVISNSFNGRDFIPALHTKEWYTYLMATAAEYGLTLQTRDVRLQNGLSLSDAELVALAEEYRDLPGFGGFYVVDEPVNPNPFARIENALRSVCPDALVNVNFLPRGCYVEGDYIRQLTDYGSLLKYPGKLSLDAYCFGNNGGVDETSLFSNYDDLRRAALMTGNDTAVYVQSVGSPKYFGYRRPSGDDLRYNMMAALAYGIKEIKFFCWGTPLDGTVENNVYTDAIIGMDNKPTDLYEAVCGINAYVHAIGRYIAACDALTVYHSDGHGGYIPAVPEELFIQPAAGSHIIVSLMQEREGNGEYVMLVNKDFRNAQTVTYTVNGLTDLQIVSAEGDLKPLEVTNGRFTLTLAPGDGAVIKLPAGDRVRPAATGADLATGAMVSATSSLGSESSYLYNIYDGKYTGEGTRLTSEDTKAEYVTFDLGAVQTVNRVDVYPAGTNGACGAYYPNDLSILVSADGKTWKTVAHKTQDDIARPIREVPVIRFADVSARYVRLSVEGFTQRLKYAEIGDVCIYNDDGSITDKIPTLYKTVTVDPGENLALNKPVVDYSSTVDAPQWNCHSTYLTDGTDKSWCSSIGVHKTPKAEEWITVDLLDVYEINRVVLTPQEVVGGFNAFPEDYTIEVSTDGDTFTPVATVTGDSNVSSHDDRVHDFDLTPARYVRLHATKLSFTGKEVDGYAVALDELMVYAIQRQSETEPDTEPEVTEPQTTEPEVTEPDTEPETETDTEAAPVTDTTPETEGTAPAEPETPTEPDATESTDADARLNTEEGSDPAPTDKGCVSAVGAAAIGVASLSASAAAVLLRKRKEDEAN